MTNTRAQGDAFRDRVFDLLGMRPGIRSLIREKPIGHQAVDIYYEELVSIGSIKVGCECKDYGTPLTRSFVEKEIYPKYYPLLVNRELDAVRIITALPVAESLQRYLESIRFTLTTIDELESQIMDFGAYLRSMISQYSEEGLNRYYTEATFEANVEAKVEDGDGAEDILSQWISRTENARPIAVLATYGMGKSSLAKRLAWLQALRHLDDLSARIPVYIPLGDISTEQDIRGLITKHFAAQHVVHNFHYELFRELNRRGRFVLIFDGFDEMKHTMSFSDIRFNFAEINQLVESRARVLLLGRPTVFKDTPERDYALHGVRENQRSIPDAVNYIELTLREFSETRSMEMMSAYGAYAMERMAAKGNACVAVSEFNTRVSYIAQDAEMSLLSRRPVQAKMLIDLAIDPQVEWRRFSRYELYEEFVSQFLERETRKVARKRFSLEKRADFQNELAWWMWRTNHTAGFEMRALPRELYALHLEHDDEADGVARDFVTGTMLDVKHPDRYFFQHRSYLEFLVAQHVCKTDWTADDLRVVSDVLTNEIVGFIKESPRSDALDSMLTFLDDIDGPLSRHFIELLGFHVHRLETNTILLESASARKVFVFWTSIQHLRHDEIIARLAKTAGAITTRESRIAAIVCMVLTADKARVTNTSSRKSKDLMRSPIAALLADNEVELRRILDAQNRRAGAALDPEAHSMRLLIASLRKQVEPSDQMFFFDSESFFEAATNLLENSVRLIDWGQSGLPLESAFPLPELARVYTSLSPTKPLGSLVQRFFNKFPDPRMLIPVTKSRTTPIRPRLKLPRRG